MIKLVKLHYLGSAHFELGFSDGHEGIFDFAKYRATRHGPLLEKLNSEAELKRAFIEAGALSWPHGLEISPQRLYSCTAFKAAA